MAVGVCDFIYLYDSPLNSPLGVEYEFVSEMFGENGENGKTDYKFLTVNQEGFSADPYPIPTYNTWVSGRIKEQKIYSKENSVYKLLEQTTTNYTSSWINNAQAVSQITDNGLKVSCYYRGDAGFGYNSSFNTGLTPLYSEFFRPVSTTSVKYFYNATGTSTQSTESVTYDYENLNHLQVTKTTKTTSDGKIKEIRQRYAQDSVANLTALATQAKAEMAARNMIANEIERIELLNGSITHGTRTNYDIRNSLVIPSNFQDKVGNNAYLTKAEINKHDNKGNFLQLTEINGISNVILWSHNSNLVIASITGVTFSQALSALGLTENEYLTESSLVHPSTNYMSRINNLRTQLPTAQIVTYTQKPLVGQAQINDINNKPTYYEYDSYGRLKFVRDNDNSLTKKYQYNIKQ
jgi:YD repeat-containing protein